MNKSETIKLSNAAFTKLQQVFYSESKDYAQTLFDQCRAEEKTHRGFGNDFATHHTSDTATVSEAAKMFAVRRVAEYLRGDKFPSGAEYLHTQTSCFIAAGIVDEFATKVRKEWTGFDLQALATLSYTDIVKVA